MRIENNQILIGGCPASEIAAIFGTPVYVYDAGKIVTNFRRALIAAQKAFHDFSYFYAIKACNNLSIAQLLTQEGAGIDAASVYEIELAKALGLQGPRIMFSGNYLSDEDIQAAFQTGAIINLDDESMLPRLLRYGIPDILSFRVNIGFGDSMLGDKVTNAGPGAKFGVHPDHIVDAYVAAAKAGVRRFGIHMMPGSCMLDPGYFHEITRLLMAIVAEVSVKHNILFEFIDLGGGLGIPYEDAQNPLDLDETMDGIAKIVRSNCEKLRIPIPKIVMEPGRYFVGDAGYIIGRVHTIKHSYCKIVGTDISMNILARPAMYGAFHGVYFDGKEGDPREPTGVCGQVCENTDFWCKERSLPRSVAEGDVVVVRDAGAYGYVMSYDYNGRVRPAEILVESGVPRLIRRRETFRDIVDKMIIPPDVAARLRDAGHIPAAQRW